MAFSYIRTVTIDHTKVPTSDQTDFPVLIKGTFSYLATIANGGKVHSSTGYDIAFFSDAALTTQLKHETELYTASNGAVAYWVKVPSVSHSTDTVIYLAYGDSSISTDQSDKNNVWDSGFALVQHLPDGSSLSLTDSTVNAHTPTNHSAAAAAGKLEGGASMASGGYYTVANSSSLNANGKNTWTIQAWIKFTDSSTKYILSKGSSDNYGFLVNSSGKVEGLFATGQGALVVNSTGTLNDGNWHQLVCTYGTDGFARLYVDGTPNNSASLTASTINNDTNALGVGATSSGSFSWTGTIDEVRVSTSTRTAEWIAAEYNNQSDPTTFTAIGAEQSTARYTFADPGGDATAGFEFWSSSQGVGAPSYDTTQKVQGVGSLKLGNDATYGGNSYIRTGAVSDTGSRISFWFRHNGITTDENILAIETGGGSYLIRVAIKSDNNLRVTRWFGSDSDTTTPLSPNTWYRISVSFTNPASNNLNIKLYVDGVLVHTTSGFNTGLTGIAQLRLGWVSQTNTDTSKFMWFDQIVVDDGKELDDIGDIRSTAKLPTTTILNNFGTTGGSGAVNERPISQTNYKEQTSTVLAKEQTYHIEAAASGDMDISADDVVGALGWIYSKAGVAGSTFLVFNSEFYAVSLTTTPTLYFGVINATSYPDEIGMDNVTSQDTYLYECGVVVLHQAAAVDEIPNASWFAKRSLPAFFDDDEVNRFEFWPVLSGPTTTYKNIATRFLQTVKNYVNTSTRFRQNVRAYSDTATRFKQTVRNYSNVATRFILNAKNYSDISTRFVQIVRAFSNAATRFKLTVRNYSDTATRFKLIVGTLAYKDVSTRFKQLVRNYSDTATRFIQWGRSYSNVATRFKQTVRSYSDTATRFKQTVRAYSDTATRFKLTVRNYSTTATRFKQVVRAYSDVATRFKQIVRGYSDSAARFRVIVRSYIDVATRFKQISRSFSDTSTRFKLVVRNYVDTTTRFILRGRGYADVATRFKQIASPSVDIATRFIQWVRSYTNVSTRFRLAVSRYADAPSRFIQSVRAFRDVPARFTLTARSYRDISTRFKQTIRDYADVGSRFKQIVRAYKDVATRFSLRVSAFSFIATRFRIIGSGYSLVATRFNLSVDFVYVHVGSRFKQIASAFSHASTRFIQSVQAHKDATTKFKLTVRTYVETTARFFQIGAGYILSRIRFRLAILNVASIATLFIIAIRSYTNCAVRFSLRGVSVVDTGTRFNLLGTVTYVVMDAVEVNTNVKNVTESNSLNTVGFTPKLKTVGVKK